MVEHKIRGTVPDKIQMCISVAIECAIKDNCKNAQTEDPSHFILAKTF